MCKSSDMDKYEINYEPGPRRSCWGKTNDTGEPSHHLAHHSMDVSAVLEELLNHPSFLPV